MTQFGIQFSSISALAVGLLAALPVHAASPQQVSNWNGGISGLPSDVSMYIYVPNKVATNPPVLTLIHYCGGTASAVFGQASDGGIVKAADQYGFIMVVPSSGRCWDVVSTKTRTRDGGGDTHAIVQMVRYALTQYQGNANRVYATGDSSGGMTTQLLLGLYPDIFKAGSSMAGMPAGCGNSTANPGGYDGACAGGTVTHTPQEWGDIVRKMYPGYSGHRARVQLFHGDADTLIKPPNFTEGIKQWTDVLGLPTNPTTTQTGVNLGTHQGTRKTWQNSCGFPVLDTFSSSGGDHGPSDALFLAQYVIPFLGLDKTGAVDPEIEQCGVTGTGGTSATGGTTGTGGKATGGASSNTGGRTSSGGTSSIGGKSASGGSFASSSDPALGGTQSLGGTHSVGGTKNGSGGVSTTVGGQVGGESTAQGGSTWSPNPNNGGIAGSVVSLPLSVGGSTNISTSDGPSGGTVPGASSDGVTSNTNSDGCGCSMRSRPSPMASLTLALGAILLLHRRRPRRCG